jgi:replicative superfamily II helicase
MNPVAHEQRERQHQKAADRAHPYCLSEGGEIPEEFLNSEKLFITTVQKLFNGQTKFGLGPRSTEVATLVMDDAHACVDSIRQASVIHLERDEQAYQDILSLFDGPLQQQGAGTLADIKSGEYESILPVPYWAWKERQAEITDIVSNLARRSSNTKPHSAWFTWPLIKNHLQNCQCIVSGKHLEISPYLAPVDLFGSYAAAKHRVFMSATVTNDAFLIKGLRLAPSSIKSPLVFKDEKWSGEKMILLPSFMDPSLDRVKIVNEMAPPRPKRTFGVVALTPSFKVAEFWRTCGALVPTTETIEVEIEKLGSGKYENVVAIASRYDGIDLPDNSCRVLIFDSLPNAQTLVDEYADSTRSQSDITAMRIARAVEQGLGRSVRGERDYCAVILIGPELVKMVRSQKTRMLLSDQTRKQIEIGLEIAQMARTEAGGADPYETFISIVNQSLKRDDGWKQFYTEQMDSIVPSASSYDVLDIFEKELTAEAAFEAGDAPKAVGILQSLIDAHVKDDLEKGWYLQEMARYALAYSTSTAENLQREAHSKNRYLMLPASGIQIEKLRVLSQGRTSAIKTWLATFDTFEELKLAVDEVLGRLEFGVKADRFEDAFHQLGKMLGFGSQRPEREWKEGPDNLWVIRDGEYLLVECKSEVKLTRAEINKTESGQMNNACAWFKRNYPGAKATNVMVIPTKKVSSAGGFNESVLALRKSGLASLVSRARKFYQEFAGLDLRNVTEQRIQELLTVNALDADHILSRFEPIEVQGA